VATDFIYFESTEGGMEFFHVSKPDDLAQLRGWMDAMCHKEDTALVMWMERAEIGELFEHRLGIMVRLKDIREVEPPTFLGFKCSKPSCTRPALYYGPIGGYGKLCKECADHKNALARAARKRLKEQRGY
jgi:hypothetical protein